ncbi:ABC transporter ATP-binding protein [Aquibacillus albus]|uniref:Energy-coupling factor transport system ATP-binding protein n=1 Tax=Aquibacillus albus TaxID=1168171 RepID=A0ABS2N2N0_9BACI|nr:ABC transporter ATP-binding protein [Aquibacillus albus]MBM7572175.1 energy-coupling factor transport system ATP-binding protein [Aquibacillus albus]
MMEASAVKVDHLTLFFDDIPEKPVLNDISFEVNEMENLLILGPSGCGKSTLTHCLNGLFPRELDGNMNGDIFINQKNATDYRNGEISQHLGVVFQDPETQFCMFTVEDEIAFGLENKGVSPNEMEDKIDEVLGLVKMKECKHRNITTLSGGQKQKLALACILAMEPEILVLDEPTANLDPVAAKEFIHTLQQLQQHKKFSLLVIEHQLDGWVSLIDRSIMINAKGEIFYDGELRHGINKHRDTLEQLGIWIPKATKLALELEKKENHTFENLPLTIHELAAQSIDFKPSLNKGNGKPNQHDLAIKANELLWSKKDTDIINAKDIHLYSGQFVMILGANGSGKSSLSKLLAGIEKPSKGSVQLYDKPLQGWRERELRTKIGYVFQNPEHQFISDTVFDEVAFSLRLQGLTEREVINRVKAILEQCQLTSFTDLHPYTLSQGQKRRLSVATMIVDNQSLLFLDEPTFGQDASSTNQLLNLLMERHAQGTGIVMITHDMELVYQYAERVLVMENGQIALDTTPEQLWSLTREQLKQWQLELPVQVKLQRLLQKDVGYVHS